jgi:hypothetical protein
LVGWGLSFIWTFARFLKDLLFRRISQIDDAADLLNARSLPFDGSRKFIGRAAEDVLPASLDPGTNRGIASYRRTSAEILSRALAGYRASRTGLSDPRSPSPESRPLRQSEHPASPAARRGCDSEYPRLPAATDLSPPAGHGRGSGVPPKVRLLGRCIPVGDVNLLERVPRQHRGKHEMRQLGPNSTIIRRASIGPVAPTPAASAPGNWS